ncbi:hypothetical protein [Duganella qianjiadongensis]|uniref:Uncharacterized protein n=1 Tax=Duganella qianjiadongensis TaxID=2692176 RepID=A0ABW9VNN3_9BURK|nr:hypothetical protein [Duganella qianjiadongensis]MYM41164.1 hypothetical protein [Duganella qianjiadongensis]
MKIASHLAISLLYLPSPLPVHAAEDQWLVIDQGWSQVQKTEWYTTSQGARLIPKDWLTALEQSGSDNKFLQPSHTEVFRYLTDAVSASLPLGFVIDRQNDRDFSAITELR